MDLNHARLPIPPRWQSELQCIGGPKAAASEDQTLDQREKINLQEDRPVYFTDHCPAVKPMQRREPEAALPTRASPSSKSSRSALSTPDSPSPPPPHISET